MRIGKAILVSDGPAGDLVAQVAGLALPKRAVSLPVGTDSDPTLPSFIELWGEEEVLRNTAASWPFSARAWRVAEHVPMAYERVWPSGEPSPGVRLVSSIHRRDGMSRADFEAYWLGPHTRVARSYTVPVWHYNQNIVLEALTGDSPEDGFVGMHFRSAEEMRARWQDYPDEARAGASDAEKFMAVERSVSMVAIEMVWADEDSTASSRS
jgi:hypothetical protein